MARISTRQLRREAGLCQTCGTPRGDRGTQLYCASCAETIRLNSQEWRRNNTNRPQPSQTKENRRRLKAGYYADCVASGRCTVCSQTLLTAQEQQHGFVNCAACRTKNREKDARSRQKKRDRAAGIPEGHPYHWPHGERPAALPGGKGEALRCGLNDQAYAALLNLWEQYRKAEIAAGRQPRTHRASQLVREAIHQWKDRLIGPSPYPHTLIARTITVYLNLETLRILEWQARTCFNGNKSAALRMILIAVGYPRPTPVAIPRHRGKWDD
jgi:uncharacterized Zn finger protein (UPF0148 family)